jgi:nitroimidazol reductase NimA-like FMN-containing flavoprotein (pyridoxamine 5'-phosphate oxidase superfamily)
VPFNGAETDKNQMEQILRGEKVGYLGLSIDGKPYVVPLNYGYVEGRIVFHCALTGRKLDGLLADPRVCFTVARQSGEVIRHPQGAHCPIETESVMCFGTARVLDDLAERARALNEFNRRLDPGADEITVEIASTCYAVEVRIAEMTGRRRHGLEHERWRHSFEEEQEEKREEQK